MPRRNLVITTNEIYHVFNRSIAREGIFTHRRNLSKICEIIEFYRFPQSIRLSKFKTLPVDLKNNYLISFRKKEPLIEVYAFAFMPNHYHFLIKQLRDNGISKFISNIQNSFAKFFNLKNNRNGALFENPFKTRRIETDEQFLHLSRYIHLNPVTSYLINFSELATYPYTSFTDYVRSQKNMFVDTRFLLHLVRAEEYINSVSDQVAYQRELALIKDLIME